jgi:hypothetical protein
MPFSTNDFVPTVMPAADHGNLAIGGLVSGQDKAMTTSLFHSGRDSSNPPDSQTRGIEPVGLTSRSGLAA